MQVQAASRAELPRQSRSVHREKGLQRRNLKNVAHHEHAFLPFCSGTYCHDRTSRRKACHIFIVTIYKAECVLKTGIGCRLGIALSIYAVSRVWLPAFL